MKKFSLTTTQVDVTRKHYRSRPLTANYITGQVEEYINIFD